MSNETKSKQCGCKTTRRVWLRLGRWGLFTERTALCETHSRNSLTDPFAGEKPL